MADPELEVGPVGASNSPTAAYSHAAAEPAFAGAKNRSR
jgi:hypothetical protein